MSLVNIIAENHTHYISVYVFVCIKRTMKLISLSFLLLQTRNVNTEKCLGELPSFVSSILERISSFPDLETRSLVLDQLTVL